MADPNHNNVQAAIDAGANLATPRLLPGFKPFTIKPKDTDIVFLDRLLEPERPQFIKAHPRFDEPASLVEYFNRFKNPASTILADLDKSTVVAIIDHHEDPKDDNRAAPGPRHHLHLATFQPKHSPEWLIWTGKNKEAMGQIEFAQFIEDNAPDVASPSAADLMEMALRFEATKGATFKSAARLQNGDVAIQYQEETQGNVAGGSIEIPKDIKLLIPVYQGGEKVEVVGRFRYRLNGGVLSLWYDLLRMENLKRAAFNSIVDGIASGTSHKVLMGRPN